MIKAIFTFIGNVKTELGKCSWPWNQDPKVKGFKKYRELWSSTIMVLITMVLLGAYVAFFDFVMAKVINAAIIYLS